MGKIRKKWKTSLKWGLIMYIPACVIAAMAGMLLIGHGTNYIQDIYTEKYEFRDLTNEEMWYETRIDENGKIYVEKYYAGTEVITDKGLAALYWVISYAQVILMPLWSVICVAVTGIIFYKRELQKPIETLLDASGKISQNCLDFEIETNREDEMGKLCQAFENMRHALYENNKETWRMLEERKRLNAAFSHDMRTPVTVLKGYTELLERYVPDGKISEEKLLEIVRMMNGQIVRLENYTQRMSELNKLEDVLPEYRQTAYNKLIESFKDIAGIMAASVEQEFISSSEIETIYIDEELVSEAYENILVNAVRYAKEKIYIRVTADEEFLSIVIEDDGAGFSEEALELAANPFFRGEKENSGAHFGLGLYISRLICEKCGGRLILQNQEHGARVTAEFCLNYCKSR